MPSGGGRRPRWTPPENDLPKLTPPQLGRPKNVEKAQAVRELLLRGATTGMVMKATGCGSSMITRVRREIEQEQQNHVVTTTKPQKGGERRE